MNKKNDPRTLVPFLISSSLLLIALIGIKSTIPTFQESIFGKGRDIHRNETLPTTVHVADYDSLDVLLERVKSTKKSIKCYWDDPNGNTKVGTIAYWGDYYSIFGGYTPEHFSFAGRIYFDKQVLIRELQSRNLRFKLPDKQRSASPG